MTVDLILHGVPNGHDIWGVSDDSHYFSTFYVQKDEKEYLTIEARKVVGKTYCYYNFLKYNGVTASDGRAGAYIGITLRFDAYYKDIANVYHLCEIVYNNLLDAILVKNGENVKFKIARYEDANRELNEIKKKVVSLIQLSATGKDFAAVNESFFNNEGKTIKAFLLDCTQANVQDALLKYGKVEVSKYFPSVNEAKKLKDAEKRCNDAVAQKDVELKDAEKRCNDTIARKDSELKDVNKQKDNLKAERDRLQGDVKSRDNEISRLKGVVSEKENIIKKNEAAIKEVNALKSKEQELNKSLQSKNRKIEQLEAELLQYKDTRKFSDIVKEIKAPLKTLAAAAGRELATFPEGSDSRARKDDDFVDTSIEDCCRQNQSFWETSIWQIAKVVLLVLILAVSVFCACSLYSSQNEKVENIDKVVKTTFIQEEQQKFEGDSLDKDDLFINENDSTKSKEDEDDDKEE
ncbi:MAG: hypothetical protein E7091_01120 [Bacteroidales bacterium]|nr:hypothetical protein [Bacteroidales bacterium]